MGAFQEHISSNQLKDLDVAIVGWIFSLYAFLTFGVGLFVGPVFDAYGPRYLIISGSTFVVLSMGLTGNCVGQSRFLSGVGKVQCEHLTVFPQNVISSSEHLLFSAPLLPIARFLKANQKQSFGSSSCASAFLAESDLLFSSLHLSPLSVITSAKEEVTPLASLLLVVRSAELFTP